jgi:plastocyanin
MRGKRFAIAALLVALALAMAGCGGDDDEGAATDTDTTTETTTDTGTTETTDTGGAATGQKLIGSVPSDDFVITLTTEDGSEVTSLPAGTYTLEIVDKTDIHNFHLSGPGVDEASDVAGQEDEEYEIELQAGTYEFVCDPHVSQMSGSFEVTG